MKKVISYIQIISFLLLIYIPAQAAHRPIMNPAEIRLALKKLNILGTVLFIAAHPDDENTAVLSYLSKEKLVRTAYLSLTRGAGGQNLIGTETGELLGVLRTQELLAARKIDGAEQYFTRAIDFGYSKTSEETIKIWGREKILYDLVWIIRKYRPDIIITRFTTDLGGHGHHKASAILALEAFRMAGDPNQFADQLEHVGVWQPKRIFWNAWRPAIKSLGLDTEKIPYIDVGIYNPLLGKSYGEISAISRSMHKSQGFGASSRFGSYREYFLLSDGDSAKTDLFEGIDLSWSRVDKGKSIEKLFRKAYQNFNSEDPTTIVPLLLEASKELKNIPDEYWRKIKQNELLYIIQSCLGLRIAATAKKYQVVADDSLNISLNVINRSDFPLQLKKIRFSIPDSDTLINLPLENNIPLSINTTLYIPERMEITQPYWLKNEPAMGAYSITRISEIGLSENPSPLTASFSFVTEDTEFKYSSPILYKWTDPVAGEKYRQIEIIPRLTATFSDKVYIFPNRHPQIISLKIKSHSNQSFLKLKLNIPQNWSSSPSQIIINDINKDEEKTISFTVTPPEQTESVYASLSILEANDPIIRYLVNIEYPHIPIQTVFPPTKAKFIRLNFTSKSKNLGYIMGSGDKIPEILKQLGFHISQINVNNFDKIDLSRFDAIIMGIRAYNTNDWLKTYNEQLINYVYNGGTLIVQYNVSRRMILDSIGPYPFKISRDRVSEENAPVKILLHHHPLLNLPYKIAANDFNGWVQERGLYFANEWHEKYQTPIASNDTEETPKAGGLLYVKYGKGIYIYTGYSFFRQIPAGIPGAIKLFINMLYAGDVND